MNEHCRIKQQMAVQLLKIIKENYICTIFLLKYTERVCQVSYLYLFDVSVHYTIYREN